MLLHGNSPRLAHSVQSTALRVFALLLACWGSVQLAQAQSSAVVQHGNGSKIFLKIDAHLLRSNLDTLFTKAADLQNQINTLSWADVLTNGTSPGVDVDFFGYSALGLGQVTTTGTVTADSLVLNKDASVAGRLVVSDVVSFGDSLLVAGTVVLGDSLRVVDAVSFGSRLHVTGVTAFGDSVHVVGNVDLDGLFNVDGAATFKSTLEVDGETTLNDTLHVAAPALLGDSLHVAGGAALSGTLSVAGNASVGGTLAASGATSLASTLAVTGLVTLSDSLHVDDNADVDGNFNVDGTTTLNGTTVDGALDVNGNADVSGTFDAGGAAALAGTLAVTGETTLHDTLHVAAPALLGDSLHVAGGAALAGTLDVAGASTLSGTQVNGTLDVNGPADVSGATALAGTLAVTGVATFADTLEVQGPGLFADSLDVAGKARFASVVYADSIVSGKVLNAQVRDLANHTTDGLVETATNRYYTPAREQAIQAQLDSLFNLLGDLLDQLFDPATITTTAATPVAATTASIRATYNAGGAQVDASGFIFSENSDLSDSTVFNVTGSSNALLKALTSLSEGTTYYYRAFIETIMGRAEGATLSFTTIADPTVSSLAVTNAGQTTATLRGSVDSAGGGVVSATGFKYGTSALLAGATNTAGSATSGTYIKALTGLAPTTTYYYAAYATNEAGTSYGDTLNFTTLGPCNGATTLNFNGYTYDIVEIGNQCWFAENLRNTSPTDICAPTPTIYTGVVPSDNIACNLPDTDYLNAYGYLYEGAHLISWSNHCPTGWSLPTNADFTALLSSVSNNALALQSTTGWGPTLSGGGTNSSGFNAFPGGASDDSGMGNTPWTGVGEQAIFWSSTTGLSFQTLTLTYGSSAASTGWWADMSGGSGGGNAASIRCIKD
jgi:uncharacterized protein (TIGR02145 family)